VRDAWERGASRPEWCFLAEELGRPVGRVGFRAEPAVSTVESLEFRVLGLWLGPDARDPLSAGSELLEQALPHILPGDHLTLDATVNADSTPMPEVRRRLFEQVGFRLFQEKEGFQWRAGTPEPCSPGPDG
jgi:hypothetical protein